MVCEGEGDNAPEKTTLDKELVIWENKNRKAYALIAASINEEASSYISPFSNYFEELNKLNEFHESHSELEVVQLIIKLFSVELKKDDPLALASEVRSITHDIKTTSVEIDIPMIAYVKAIYPTYSHYLVSLQASGNLKEITFDSLEKKFVEREKDFWKRTTPHSIEEAICLAQKEKNHAQYSSRGRGGQRGRGRRNFRGRGAR